jgi:hypothetical protein
MAGSKRGSKKGPLPRAPRAGRRLPQMAFGNLGEEERKPHPYPITLNALRAASPSRPERQRVLEIELLLCKTPRPTRALWGTPSSSVLF